MPTNTDLVTDLPADFAVFGQAVDTSMADLLGGTTGQILAKATNTNMDFVWIANDQGDITGVTAGTGITVTSPTGPVPTVSIDTATTVDKTTAQTLTNKTLTSPVLTTPSISNINAKGDILVGTADNTLGIITAGNNGETLLADSSTSTGLRYQGSMAAGKNYVINGAMDFWQRGTSSSSAGYTAADRYYNSLVGTTTVSQSTDVPTNSNAQYSLKWLTGASSSYAAVLQALESAVVKPLRNQPMVLSFYVKTAGSYAGNILANVTYSNSTDALASVTTSVTTAGDTSFAGSSVTSWTRKSITFTVPSDAVGLRFELTTNTAQASGVSFFVTSIQLETGSVATQFSRAGGTISGELAACQRYLPAITAFTADFAQGQCISTTKALITIPFQVQARTAPTGVTVSSAGNFSIRTAAAAFAGCTAIVFNNGNITSASIEVTVASGVVAGNATGIYNAGSGTLFFTGCEL